MPPSNDSTAVPVEIDRSGRYREVQRKTLVRLLLIYWLPLILITGYFAFQFNAVQIQTNRLRMQSIAENQAQMLNLFLRERVNKLVNLIDDPRFIIPPEREDMKTYFLDLQKNSSAYIDISFFDPSGVQTTYVGPFLSLQGHDYSGEEWYQSLKESHANFIITDDYLGFRQKPHFTIAVSRTFNTQFYVLRATLDPIEIYRHISTGFDSEAIHLSIVNAKGFNQIVSPQKGVLLEASSIIPPRNPATGIAWTTIKGKEIAYAYSWLQEMDWAIIVQWEDQKGFLMFIRTNLTTIFLIALFHLIVFIVIQIRAKKLVNIQWEQDQTQLQLQHAAKLVSVGELAAGIAHEINNPLAIVCSESGLMKDLLDPQFGEKPSEEEMTYHLDNIREAAFRCRDITRNLLDFVRTSDTKFAFYDLHAIIDEVVERWVSRKMALANIEIRKKYFEKMPPIRTDKNRLQQVLLNIITNAKDAVTDRGWITIQTNFQDDQVIISIADSGRGMSPDEMEKIFLPFYTTKEVGKGTGLGLPVSYGIIKNLGGKITVESKRGKGSKFTIVLPQPLIDTKMN
ncbi:MAG: ATP-binding protein [Candidatus Omnitrophica bacterium]|nr:ATP-binding protein [Candidatus Omnitrophota bacterium]